MSLSLSDIQKGDDLKIVEFEVPEWGGSVFLKPMTVETSEKTLDGLANGDQLGGMIHSMAEIVYYCVCDEDGNRLFKSVKQVRDQSTKSIQRIGEEIIKLNSDQSGNVD